MINIMNAGVPMINIMNAVNYISHLVEKVEIRALWAICVNS